MNSQAGVNNQGYNLLPTEVDGFGPLADLALDMRWSWNHAADEVWRRLDSELWELTHNPWVVLQTVSRDQLNGVLADPAFSKKVDDLVQAKRTATQSPAWFQQQHPGLRLPVSRISAWSSC